MAEIFGPQHPHIFSRNFGLVSEQYLLKTEIPIYYGKNNRERGLSFRADSDRLSPEISEQNPRKIRGPKKYVYIMPRDGA